MNLRSLVEYESVPLAKVDKINLFSKIFCILSSFRQVKTPLLGSWVGGHFWIIWIQISRPQPQKGSFHLPVVGIRSALGHFILYSTQSDACTCEIIVFFECGLSAQISNIVSREMLLLIVSSSYLSTNLNHGSVHLSYLQLTVKSTAI